MSKFRAYKNATIINGDASVEVIEKGTILVDEKGKISAIGKVEDVEIPAGCPVVDLTGKYVMPGLINAHVHLFMPGGPRKEMIGEKDRTFTETGQYSNRKTLCQENVP